MQLNESKKPFVILLCLIAIIVSAVFIVRQLVGTRIIYDEAVDVCLGETLAKETGRLLGGQGKIVVISMAGGELKSVVAEAQMKGFRRALKTQSGLAIEAVVRPTEQELMVAFEGVPEEFFLKTVASHPNAQAIVSFMGLPMFAPSGARINVDHLPKIIALHTSGMGNWQDLVRAGVFTAVVVPRYDVRWDQLAKKGECGQLFADRYWVVTRANYDSMAEQLKQYFPSL
jgi:hypothetical protein